MELPYPQWRSPLQEMLIELDREKLAEKAVKAEALIFERLRELEQSNDGHHERRDLARFVSPENGPPREARLS